MTLTRYNEIMDRVTVTPEMRERVLANATEAAAKPIKRRVGWKPYLLVAACLALVLLGSLTVPKLVSGPVPSGPAEAGSMQGGWNRTEYDSAEALSKAAGFSVSEIPALAEAASEKACALIGGNLAEITYTVESAACTYRVSPGSEDNSGDYNEYASVQTAEIGGVSVTLKGDETGCHLALWEANGFSYSLSCGDAIPCADMEAYVASALQP